VAGHVEPPPDVALVIVGEEGVAAIVWHQRNEPEESEYTGQSPQVGRVHQDVDSRAPGASDDPLGIAQDAVADSLLAKRQENAMQEKARRIYPLPIRAEGRGSAGRVSEPGDVYLVGQPDQGDLIRRERHGASRPQALRPWRGRSGTP
jgi:hypothetical protein